MFGLADDGGIPAEKADDGDGKAEDDEEHTDQEGPR